MTKEKRKIKEEMKKRKTTCFIFYINSEGVPE